MATAIELITESYNLTIYGKMEICPKNKGKYITSDYLSYSDYHGTDVHWNNVDYIIENYASTRYHLVSGGSSYTQVYLKFTAINAHLIISLDEDCIIDDCYYYEWQQKRATEEFYESSVSYYPVIAQALSLLHEDTDWTVSPNILQALHHFSELWCGGEVYHWSAGSYYFSLQDSHYATNDNINEVVLYFIDNSPYCKKDLQSTTIDHIIQNVSPGIYTLVATSYNDLVLYGGGIDYMTTHEYPMQEIIINDDDDIESTIQDAYNEIVEYNFEYLNYAPI